MNWLWCALGRHKWVPHYDLAFRKIFLNAVYCKYCLSGIGHPSEEAPR